MRPTRTRPLLLCLMLCCASAPAAAAPAPPVLYTVRYLADGPSLAVSACTRDASPRRAFEATGYDAWRYIDDEKRSSGRELAWRGGEPVGTDWQAGECLAYRVAIDRIAALKRRDVGYQVGSTLVVSPDMFLWRPLRLARDPASEIRFELPVGIQVSVPWRPLDPPPHRRFQLGSAPPEWSGWVAFGDFPEREVRAAQGSLRLAMVGDFKPANQERLVAHVSLSAAELTATFPRTFDFSPQVLAFSIPAERSRDASPFGATNRSGNPAIFGLMKAGATDAEYARSWTYTHEFAHLLHPYLGTGGRWLGEGIATYYQNVLRARSGRLTPTQAWDELDAGFERGRKNHTGKSVTETSDDLGDTHHYMRTYWAGTALALQADLALRTRATNPTTLDAVLNAWIACCRARTPELDAEPFTRELDRLAGGDTFQQLHRRIAPSLDFPDLAPTYRTLGLTHAPDHVQIDRTNPQARALRTAIMGTDDAP